MYKFVFCRCQFDYLDIYAEVTDATLPFIDTPLLGRFCGDGTDRLPNLIISTSNIIILDFYSDNDKADKGFQGRYKFINDCRCITGWIALIHPVINLQSSIHPVINLQSSIHPVINLQPPIHPVINLQSPIHSRMKWFSK
jgi:hypothetical protein